jgi:hypothetical protein
MKKLAILIILVLNLPIVAVAQNAPQTLGDCYVENQCDELGSNRKTRQCKRDCRAQFAEEEGLSSQELINNLVPSQNDLFGQGSDVKLATGDLEQGLAPRILNILIAFSAVIGLVLFTYLGVRLSVARNNEEEFTKVKRAITNTFIGAIIIAASFGIVIGILRVFEQF